jgi:hypothetical protein
MKNTVLVFYRAFKVVAVIGLLGVAAMFSGCPNPADDEEEKFQNPSSLIYNGKTVTVTDQSGQMTVVLLNKLKTAFEMNESNVLGHVKVIVKSGSYYAGVNTETDAIDNIFTIHFDWLRDATIPATVGGFGDAILSNVWVVTKANANSNIRLASSKTSNQFFAKQVAQQVKSSQMQFRKEKPSSRSEHSHSEHSLRKQDRMSRQYC